MKSEMAALKNVTELPQMQIVKVKNSMDGFSHTEPRRKLDKYEKGQKKSSHTVHQSKEEKYRS